MTDPNRPRGPIGLPPSPPPLAMTPRDSMTYMLAEVRTGFAHLALDFQEMKDDVKERMNRGNARFDTIEAAIRRLEAPKPQPPEKTELGGWEVALKRPVPWIIAIVVLALTGKLELVVRLIEAAAKLAEASG